MALESKSPASSGPMRRMGMILGAALAVFAVAIAPAAAQSRTSRDLVTLTVSASDKGPVLHRDIFGQFAEHLGEGIYGGIWVGETSAIPNVRGIRTDVVEALRALKVPNVRWPGGCFADEYDWRDGIGPRSQRPVTLNPNWGGVTESNQFGTHEFFDLVEQIGSEAYVSVNVATGTPREASEWLEYMTSPLPSSLQKERVANGRSEPFRVPLLGLGNENWGCGGSMTAEHYVEEMKSFARFARNFDPAQTGTKAMKRIAVGPDGDKPEYTEAVMSAWKNKVWAWDIEGISLHSYTVGGWPPSYNSSQFGEREYAALVADTLRMKDMLAKHIAIMDRHDPEKKIGLYVDEWGVWLAPTPGTNPGFLAQQNTIRDAVIASLNLNLFSRNADRVRGANIAQMINVLQAMILTDGPKMVLTPTYHVFHMYVPFQNAKVTPITLDAGNYTFGDHTVPRLDAIAARDEKGQVWLAVTNVDPNSPANVRVAIEGRSVSAAVGEVLTAPRVDTHNTFAAPNTVRPRSVSTRGRGGSVDLVLPAKSVTVVRLESGGR